MISELTTRQAVRSRTIVAFALLAVTSAGTANAAPTREECVEAHGRGQDLREEGHLTKARQTFLTCSQQTCPALVQSDCARYAEELGRLVPTLTFAARDSHASDLANTSVYLDEQLLAMRLDEGKTYEVDPGKHAVRFVHDGKEVLVRVVVNQGEKGRNVIATFMEASAAEPLLSSCSPNGTPAAPATPSRPIFPLVVAGAGGLALATGVVLVAVGLGKVPSTCSNSTKECAAPPGDKTFEEARSGVSTANIGLGISVVGGVMAAGGLLWYFVQSPYAPSRTGKLAPWVGPGTGGMSLSGAF
jgi:hypothetical protein